MMKWNEFNFSYNNEVWYPSIYSHTDKYKCHLYHSWSHPHLAPVKSSLINTNGEISVKCTNNVELLKEAKSVYTHPLCKFPRTLYKGKFKRCDDPILADIVVLPDIRYSVCAGAIFECSELKGYQISSFDWNRDQPIVEQYIQSKGIDGVLLSDVLTHFGADNDTDITYPEKYKCVYMGPMVSIEYTEKKNLAPKSHLLLNYMNGLYMENKTFSEDFFTKYLSQENTSADITYDMVISLHEMLQSNDGDTNSAALKTLASLNYLEYPNTIKYLLQNTWYSWKYNNAKNATSVKYMRKALDIPNRGYYCNSFFGDISQKDYDLFTRVFYTIEKYTDMGKCLQRMINLSFMRCNAEGKVVPNLKDEN